MIETATTTCSIALLDGDVLIDERHEVVGRGHAERLVPMIRDMMGNEAPDAVLVDCGPGSFTGIRVGLAAARALGLAWRVPVGGYSSLALIAAAAPDPAGHGVAVAITGGHGELFVQHFAGTPPRATGDLASLTPEAAARATVEDRVLGSGAAVLVAARGYGTATDAAPRAADLIGMDPADTMLPPRPIYGRAPDAALPA